MTRQEWCNYQNSPTEYDNVPKAHEVKKRIETNDSTGGNQQDFISKAFIIAAKFTFVNVGVSARFAEKFDEKRRARGLKPPVQQSGNMNCVNSDGTVE